MSSRQINLALLLFGLGFIGILSLLSARLPMDDLPPEVTERFSENMIRVLTLINPMILLMIAVAIGVWLHEKVKLDVPILRSLSVREKPVQVSSILAYGAVGGVLAGVAILAISAAFQPALPAEFLALNEKVQLSVAARLLYGGITEELLLRFGFMTLAVWGIFRLFKRLTPGVYWVGIAISALVFALGHFPVVFQAVEAPSAGLLSYILLGNAAGGLIFGWLYWKKGLEAAIIAHMMAHVVMLVGESI